MDDHDFTEQVQELAEFIKHAAYAHNNNVELFPSAILLLTAEIGKVAELATGLSQEDYVDSVAETLEGLMDCMTLKPKPMN